MTEGQIIELLSQLPDGVFITHGGRVAKIENGVVTEMVDKVVDGAPSQRIGTGDDDPRNGSN